ncbi:hypothetical protein [Gorillibacterium massiliense]|uniref:YphA family membrane protein n=1 Tax=Gorillibacterium massiliense TaxID=1280390 RepID=UPI0004ADBA75|nr:hypothetical protein [Gorillibacterium massiliense]
MNSGYLGYLIMAVCLILLMTGWKDVFLRGIKGKSLLLFFVFWIAFSFADFPFATMKINGVVIVLILVTIGSFVMMDSGEMRYRAAAAGLMLGLVDYLLTQLVDRIPISFLTTPDLDLALLYSVLISLRFRPPILQVSVLTIGLLFGDLLNGIAVLPEIRTWGGPAFWDRWWVSVSVARVLSAFVSILWAFSRLKGSRLAAAVKGRKSR